MSTFPQADEPIVTLDIDWAPDFVIDFVASLLLDSGVKATWFVTHSSPAIDRLRENPLFELGIHPNFMQGSTHGSSIKDVINYCLELVPNARSMRTHGLYQSSHLLQYISCSTAIDIDVSLLLPRTAGLRPVEYISGGRPLLRIPYYWEDDVEMDQRPSDWKLSTLLRGKEGLKVFDFHPIHVYLNSSDMAPYERVKAAGPRLSERSKATVDREIQTGSGTRTLFEEVLAHLRSHRSFQIRDLRRSIDAQSATYSVNA